MAEVTHSFMHPSPSVEAPYCALPRPACRGFHSVPPLFNDNSTMKQDVDRSKRSVYFARGFDSPTIRFVVGPSQKVYNIHQDVLMNRCPFLLPKADPFHKVRHQFRLSDGFATSVHIKDCSSDVFDVFVGYVYHESCAMPELEDFFDMGSFCLLYAQIYIFAHTFLIFDLGEMAFAKVSGMLRNDRVYPSVGLVVQGLRDEDVSRLFTLFYSQDTNGNLQPKDHSGFWSILKAYMPNGVVMNMVNFCSDERLNREISVLLATGDREQQQPYKMSELVYQLAASRANARQSSHDLTRSQEEGRV